MRWGNIGNLTDPRTHVSASWDSYTDREGHGFVDGGDQMDLHVSCL